ncbi:MAG TPA: acyl-ACP desaturase [Gemmataceae bacterium]|nr:acyl-ACP desaturase [Gemmataceae bacterium]
MLPHVPSRQLDTTGLEEAYYRLFREFFDKAEKKRRWSIREDIPWDQVNRNLNPALGDVLETFCTVELYLPDYIEKAWPLLRRSRGREWFHANWGYEEAKHSMAMGDWLIASGQRTEDQLREVETLVGEYEWNLPHDSPIGMVLYGMTQELATFLHYRNLNRCLDNDPVGDPALSKVLRLICVDERAHHDFYKQITLLYLERDRAGTIEALRRVVQTFAMPAVDMLANSRQRVQAIRELKIFDEDIFFLDVVKPILAELNIEWSEFRQRKPNRRSISTPSLP